MDPEKKVPSLMSPSISSEKLESGTIVDIDVDEVYSYEEQRKIVHRVDKRLVCITGIGYCICLMDRTNVSNASIAGMNDDLHMTTGYRYSLVMLIFFVPYVIFQPFSTALIRKIGPRIFLTTMIMAWAGITVGIGFTKDWTHVLAARTVLGVLESGYFPGVVYLLSTWYSRYELHKRFSFFYSIGLVVQALANILAFGLTKMEGIQGIRGWRWIFIIEGVITGCVALLTYFLIVEFPDKSHKSWRFLSENEAAFIIRRLNRDRGDAMPEKFSLRGFLRHAADIRLWCYGLIFCCLLCVTYSITFFLPLILRNGMGYSVGASQALSAPPYVAAGLLMVAQGWAGDKYRNRSMILLFNAAVSIIGLALMGFTHGNGVRYLGMFLVTSTTNASATACMTWQSNNIRGQWKRALSSSIMVGMGGIGGIAGSLVFRSQDAPSYLPGIYATITASAMIIVITGSLTVYFMYANRKADRNEKILEESVDFRYTL
ncbi:hypothetical protein FE257_005693 [Aspergillus nanangensis]|uniref:Major facilitator superfamily (MFS) profile domain-containing protein n=1 Tax=Aspergillus nanangensis TaxID=2582783 RepID=A0AAD4GV87_ASPNN|nr:hypothetical protein FE257_005693 [Aspergillus nanangensis]